MFSFLIYFRRDIVLPGDLFTGTSNWSDRDEREGEEDGISNSCNVVRQIASAAAARLLLDLEIVESLSASSCNFMMEICSIKLCLEKIFIFDNLQK